MKKTKLIECARKSLVVLLAVAMVWSSLPTTQIAMALTEPVVQPAIAEQPVTVEDSAVEDQAATKETPAELPETAAEQVAPAEQAPAEKADAPVDAPSSGEQGSAENPAEKPAEEKPALADQDAAENPAPAEKADANADEGAPALTARDLKNAKLVKARMLSDQEAAELLGADAQLDPAPADGPSSAEAADGTKIENVKLSWLDGKGQNAVGDELTINSNSNDKIDIRARIDIKLKGPKKYAPGMVRIKVPMNFLKDRNGLHVGEMVMSVPEAPGGDATFSYVKMDESYVIINNVEIPGSSAMYFEFSCKGITPKDLKSGTKAAMRAAAELRAETGELLTAASKEATVTVNTSGRVSYPSNTVDRLSENWQNFLPSELEPENPKDYVYCDFYSSASISSGQPFDLEVTHDASGTGRGARMLGMRDQYGKVYKNEDPTSSKMTVQLVKGDYPYGNYGAFVHAYVAFPKSEIETNGRHLFKDHVTYTMKTIDDQVVTSTDGAMGSPDAEKVFAPLEFVIPHGHFYFSKRGSIPLSENGKMVSWGLPNTTALNELQRGREAEVSWYMRSESFNAPYTWLDENGDKKMEAAELEKTSVAVETKDSGLTIPAAGFGDVGLTGDDYEFSSLKLDKPKAFHYVRYTSDGKGYFETKEGIAWGTIEADSFGYKPVVSDSELPEIEVRGKIAGKDGEVLLARISWADSVAKAVELYKGAKLEGSTLLFPKGVTEYRTVVDSPISAVMYETYPTARIKPSEKMREQVQKVLDREESPSMAVRNKAQMNSSNPGGSSQPVDFTIKREADDALEGSVLGVWADQKIGEPQNDTVRGQVKMHVATVANEQTNINQKDQYDQLVKNGAIQKETSGTFYELLPAGVVPDMESIRLRSGDLLKSARVMKNYKGSGCSLLVVEALLSPIPSKGSAENPLGKEGFRDAPVLEFDVIYPWEEMAAFGKNVTVVAAFESGNSGLGTRKGLLGEPDDPLAGNNQFSRDAVQGVEKLMTDLDPDRNDAAFVYARANQDIDVVTSGLVGFAKQVSVNGDGLFGSGLRGGELNVYEGGRYSYRLRMRNDNSTKSQGIVFYDRLEGAVPTTGGDSGDQQWKGELANVDVSALKASGVAPVVYYSTTADLDFSNVDGADLDLANGSVWTKKMPTDASKITAIAIDCSKASNGRAFTLEPGEMISAEINMKAPMASDLAGADDAATWYDVPGAKGADEQGLEGGAHAYNEATMLASSADVNGATAPVRKVVTSALTKVGLRNAAIDVHKIWKDGEDQDGLRPQNLRVALVANGKDEVQAIELSPANGWSGSFEGVRRVDDRGAAIEYSVVEAPVPGYTGGVRWVSGESPSHADVCTITNVHEPERIDISGTKTWVGDEGMEDMRPDSIRVELYRVDGDLEEPVSVETVKPAADGTWTYTFEGMPKYKGGKEVSYGVREVGSLGAYECAANGTDLVNTFLPQGTLKVSKEVVGAGPANAAKSFAFHLELTDHAGAPDTGSYQYERVTPAPDGSMVPGEGGSIANGGTFVLSDGESIVIRDLPAGTKYKVEEEPVAGYRVLARGDAGVVAGNDAHASFRNTYSSRGSMTIRAKKELTGRDLAGDQFLFELREGNNLLRRTRNEADGTVAFGEIRFTEKDAGKTFTYTVTEKDAGKAGYTYDAREFTVTVTPIDNGNGTIAADPTYTLDGKPLDKGTVPTFVNEYNAAGELVVRAYKELEGRDLQKDEFTFALTAGEGDAQRELCRATNDEDGLIEFKAQASLSDELWADGKPTKLAISEVAGDDETVVYSDQTFGVEVTPHDDGTGKLTFDQKAEKSPVFKNKLKPGALRIEKRAEGGDPNQEFTFNVKLNGADGQELPDKLKYDVEYLATGANLEERIADAAQNAEPKKSQEIAVAESSSDGCARHGEKGPEGKGKPTLVSAKPCDARTRETAHKTIAGTHDTKDASVNDGRPAAAAEHLTASNIYLGRFLGSGTVRNGEDDNTATWKLYEGQPYWSNDSILVIDGGVMNLEKIVNPPVDKWGDEVPPVNEWLDLGSGHKVSEVGTVLFEGTKIKCLDGAFVEKFNSFTKGEWEALKYVGGTVDMSECESATHVFNGGDEIKTIDIDGFTVENADSCAYLFNGCSNLTSINLKSFKATKVKDLRNMFADCSKLNNVNLPELNVQNAVLIDRMFKDCRSLETLDVSNLDTSKVTSMRETFANCEKLRTIDVSHFDTSQVVNMSGLFDMSGIWPGPPLLEELNLKSFNTSNVTDMSNMFSGCGSLKTLDVTGFDTSSAKDMSRMFSGCELLERIDVSHFNTSNATDMSYMFNYCSNLTELDLSNFRTDNVEDMSGMFSSCEKLSKLDISSFKTQKVKDMNSMFEWCKALPAIDVSHFDTGNVESFDCMFGACDGLKTLNVANFNTANATDMGGMFRYCNNLTHIEIGEFDTTNVSDMKWMFRGCKSLTSIDLSSFNTEKIKDMSAMFMDCSSLTSIDVSNFKTDKVETMEEMFSGCSSLKSIDLRSFTATSLENMAQMFLNCSQLTKLDLSTFKKNSLGSMYAAFYGCTSLQELDISGLGNESLNGPTRIFGDEYGKEGCLENLAVLRLGEGWKSTWKTSGGMSISWWKYAPLPELPADHYLDAKWVRDEDSAIAGSSEELCKREDLAGTWRHPLKEGYVFVSYDANLKGASGQMKPGGFEVKEGSTVTLPDCSFTHPKYNFDSWNTKADGTGKRCPAGVPIENFAKPGDKVTLYAQWKSKELPTAPVTNGEFEITIHAGEAAVIKDVPVGVGYTVTEKTPAGWKLVESAKTTGEIKTNEPAVATFLNAPNKDKPNAIEGSIAASKLLDGKPAPAGAFDFQLIENGKVLQTKANGAGGGISFDPIEYTEAGEHTYQIKEVRGTDKSIVYDASDEELKVAVTEGKDGKLSVTTEYTSQDDTAGRAVFHNKHADGSLTVTKAIEGDAPAGKTFGFRVDWDGGKTSNTFELRAGESKTFENVPAGTRYQVTEASMPGGFTQVSAKGDAGKIESGVAANAVITNKYGIAQGAFAVIEASKVLEGAPLGADQFAFELLGADGVAVATAKNGPDGSIMFDAQTYDAPGDYAYKVREVNDEKPDIVYDSTKHDVTVHVTDNCDGTLSAQVDYGEPGKIVFHNQMTCKFIPTATKVLQGGELAQDQFTFELRNAEQGGDVISTAKNDAAGNIAFEPITYGASDVGKTFEYWISEVDDGRKGIAYDTKSVHVTVSVELDASGVITATAVYDGDPLATFTNVAVVDPGPEQPGPGKPDPEIPGTGGPGIAGGILAGMAMVLLSAVEIVRRKRAQGM